MNHFHVMPVDDIVEHEDSENCLCGPEAHLVQGDDGSDNWVLVHHSLDGREMVE